MAEMDTLEKLVTSLSLDERQKMFEKLQAQSNLSGESLYPASAEGEQEQVISPEEQYAKLPWYYRLYYFVLSLFKNKPSRQIFQDSQVSSLGRRIDLEHPGFYNFQKGLLLAEFYQLLLGLKNDARFFFDALDVSVNRDRGGFFSFLGSLEMAEVHRRLETETIPEKVREKNPTVPETELRQAALRVMEEAFAGITEVQRTTMYRNARSLYCLKELSSFLYDRVLLAFAGGEEGETCSIYVVKDMLGSLNNILFALKEPPSLTLLESLFIFILQEKAAEPGFDSNRELQRLLNRAEGALANLRNFNRRIPLTLILRCGNRSMAYNPRQISGGEDWYAVYRDYWRRHIGDLFTAYMKDHHYRELREKFTDFFMGASPLSLANVASEENSGGLPVSGALSLSFLFSFNKLVFIPDINLYLQPIVAEGEFLQKENRTEFTGSYNDLAKLGDDIQNLDGKMAPDGIYGERYAQARQDMSSLPVKRRKIQLVLEDATEEGTRIVERTRVAADSIINIITGILKKDRGGKYDSLSNLPQLEAKQPNFQTGLQNARERFKEMLRILDSITGLETESAKG
ncbi:MAG: DUF5312 domain-containing protein [Treponema sp.]|jgi:hypothetical protein|nr:DUF5312 domain-containing protein [Treponema sp.]